jgi:putative membrane protein
VWNDWRMRSFIVRILVNGLALWVASWILPGLEISTSATTEAVAKTGVTQGTDTIGLILAYLFIGLIFGVVNAFVRPLVSFLSLPITILTLGLFTIVINAAMLYLTSWISSYTPVRFTIDSFFWTAVLAAIIITLISLVAGRAPGGRRR